MDINSLGAIAGCIIGMAGGLLGTFCGIKACRHPQQKKHAITVAIISWLAVLVLFSWLGLSLGWSGTTPDSVGWNIFHHPTPPIIYERLYALYC